MIFFNICIAWFSYIALCQPVHSDTWNGDIPQPFSFLFYFFYKNILSNRYLLFIFLNYPTKSLYKFISILNIFQYFEHIFLENLFLYLVVYARKPLFYETFIVPNCKKETQTYDLRVMSEVWPVFVVLWKLEFLLVFRYLQEFWFVEHLCIFRTFLEMILPNFYPMGMVRLFLELWHL